MSNIPLSLSFDLVLDDSSSLKNEGIRAGIYNNLAYLLITQRSRWIVPLHFNAGTMRVLLVGGGGAGGDYTQDDRKADSMKVHGGSGLSSFIRNNAKSVAVALGGKHGTSAFSGTSRPAPPSGGGLGGFQNSAPSDGSSKLSKPITAINSVLLANAANGSAGTRLAGRTVYDGVAGGGAAGFVPFQDLKPEAWGFPQHTSNPAPNAGSPGLGFGAGGGGTASDSNLSKIGTSGGGRGGFTDVVLSYSPGDIIDFYIGRGGKRNRKADALAQNGKAGLILIYLSDAIPFLPHELPSPNVQNYRIAPTNHIFKTTMEYGIVRQRRLSLQNSFSLQCSWLFSEQQFFLFSSWFFHQIENGSKAFVANIKNPYVAQKNHIVRFSQPFQAQLVSNNLWRVDAKLNFSENVPPNLIQQQK